MKIQSIHSLKGVLLLSGAVFLTACGGGGDSGGTPGGRIEQNAVYINTAQNTVMAARDDGSITPFGLVSITGGQPFDLSVSPDSLHVAFEATNSAGITNLYVTHSNGAYFTQVTNLPTGRSIRAVAWSPDGDQLVYLADALEANKQELFKTTMAFDSSQNISASNVRISGSISSSVLDIADPSWSPDGSKIAYLVTNSNYSTANKVIGVNYHDVSIGGRHSVRLSTPVSFPAYQDITGYAWSADGNRLAYLSNPANNFLENVYQIDFTAGSLTPAAGTLQSGYSVVEVAYSADSQSLATRRVNVGASQYRLRIENTASGSEIYTANSAGRISRMKWGNQTSVLAYRVENDATGNYSLNVADLDRAVYDIDLHNGDTSGENALSFQWSHDDDRLALTTQGTSSPFIMRLRAYNVSSRNSVLLSTMPSGRLIGGPRWSLDDQRIAFNSAEAGCRNAQVHSTPATSSNVINLDDIDCPRGFVY